MLDTTTRNTFIQTFGDCYVSSGGRLLNPPFNLLRLLVYILLEGQGEPVMRRRIGDLIWSDNGPEQAYADIRQALVRIRRFQEENGLHLLATDAQMVWLTLDSSVHFDLAEFVKLAADPVPAAWVRMCAIYNKGELLSSLRAAGEGFEEWLSYQRSRLRYDFLSIISQAVLPDSGLTAHDRHFCASTLLGVDPYHEGAQRALMRDAAANGQFAFVRQSFEDFTRKLRNELGVNPDDETVRLYERLIAGTRVT